MTLAWIVLACLAGGLLSVLAAAFALVLRAKWVPMLVSFASGTLLGAAFLEVLPHMLRYRMTERIGLGSARLLLIRGEFDRPSPRRFHSRLVAASSDAAQWEIRGAAHSTINGHAVGVARLIVGLVHDDLPARGRLSSEESRVPPAPYGDVRMVLAALGSRIDEWISALRRDEHGVARAKARHARLLWRAYVPRR